MKNVTGRWAHLNDESEIAELEKGMDFRHPKYRREVFLRFYEFHLKYKSHPGGVYFAFPWLAKYYNQTTEDKLWMAFINGCSQNIVTTSMIYERFPKLEDVNIRELDEWWNGVQHKFKAGSGWDTDRKYFKVGKTGFPQCVESYKEHVDKFGSQEAMFNELTNTGDKYKNFEKTWDYVRTNFLSFGRLSTFSYLEYLRIQGVDLDCNSLFLDDISGSKSHRNGLCKVLGRDDLDWWKDKVTYCKDTLSWLEEEGEALLAEARERFPHEDVSYFTLESTFCCYKSWHRPNRRYPNVYMDMMYDRIKYAESEWGNRFQHFWEMRRECLPEHLRLEDNPKDPGLKPEKQNHYRETGEVVMMENDWDCFSNDFNKNARNLEEFFG
jgi:hypothetical protein